MTEVAQSMLPLGSIVRTGGDKLLMIAARGVILNLEGQHYLDYGACAFPEGCMGGAMLYFNNDDIVEVVHEGFSNEEDSAFVDRIREAGRLTDVPRGDPRRLRNAADTALTASGAARG